MGGGRVPGAEAPCFSVGGDARTEVRAYLRSKSDDGESVLRECGGAKRLSPFLRWRYEHLLAICYRGLRLALGG